MCQIASICAAGHQVQWRPTANMIIPAVMTGVGDLYFGAILRGSARAALAPHNYQQAAQSESAQDYRGRLGHGQQMIDNHQCIARRDAAIVRRIHKKGRRCPDQRLDACGRGMQKLVDDQQRVAGLNSRVGVDVQAIDRIVERAYRFGEGRLGEASQQHQGQKEMSNTHGCNAPCVEPPTGTANRARVGLNANGANRPQNVSVVDR